MRLRLFACGLVLLAATASAGQEMGTFAVRFDQGLLDLQAEGTPLHRVIDELARKTGMKVVYDGVPPSVLVRARFERLPPSEALPRLFEGLGLNYMMALDRTQTRVESLILVASPGTGGPSEIAAKPRSASAAAGLFAGHEQMPSQMPGPGGTPPAAEIDEDEGTVDEVMATITPTLPGLGSVPAAGPMSPNGTSTTPAFAVESATTPAPPPADTSSPDWALRNGSFPGSVPRPPDKPHPQD